MSFSQLPNETIQLIVDKCAEADRAYKDRKGEQEIKRESQGKKGLWKGRSCIAISLVNRGLRDMAIKHIFKTLPVSKAEDDSFQFYILDSITATHITQVRFESSYAPSNLFRVVIQILPRLPGLRSVVGLESQHLSRLCGGGGLSGDPTASPPEPKQIRARNVILELATRIVEWDLSLEGSGNFRAIAAVKPEAIRHLRLSSSKLFSSKSRFPSILATLPNLQSLNLKQVVHSYSGQVIDLASNLVLEIPFKFANSLLSLELNFQGDPDRKIVTDLHFASLFPSLNRLVLSANGDLSREEDDDKFLVFGSLEYLEVKDLKPDQASLFFENVELPVSLEVHLNDLKVASCDTDLIVHFLMTSLEPYESSLRVLRLSRCMGFDSTLPSIISKALPSVILELDIDTLLALKLVHRRLATTDDFPSSSPSSTSSSVPTPLMNPFFEKTNDVLDWARSKAEFWKNGDLKLGKELMKALQRVEEMKDWLEE